jgi:hypothetical protein
VQLAGAGSTLMMKGNSQFIEAADDWEDGCSHMDFWGSMEDKDIFGEVMLPHYERILSATESHMVSQKGHHLLTQQSALERPRIICWNLVWNMRNAEAIWIWTLFLFFPL